VWISLSPFSHFASLHFPRFSIIQERGNWYCVARTVFVSLLRFMLLSRFHITFAMLFRIILWVKDQMFTSFRFTWIYQQGGLWIDKVQRKLIRVWEVMFQVWWILSELFSSPPFIFSFHFSSHDRWSMKLSYTNEKIPWTLPHLLRAYAVPISLNCGPKGYSLIVSCAKICMGRRSELWLEVVAWGCDFWIFAW
jgi:hypothetical protein